MSFGLTNAPVCFQEYNNKILAKKVNSFVIVYINDILIYTEDDGDGHVGDVRWVLEQLRQFLLFANLKKCHFYQKEIWFLDYVLSLESIRMKAKRIEVVKQWPKL